MSEVFNDRILPEEALGLASAIAWRDIHSDIVGDQIAASLEGAPYVPSESAQKQRTHLTRAVLYLAKVENPGSPISWLEIFNASCDAESYTAVVAELNEHAGVEMSTESLMNVGRSLVAEVRDATGMADEKDTEDFARTLKAAKEVARDHNVDVATVYATDGLYFEAYRRAFSVQETADELHSVLGGISEDLFNRVILQQLENILSEEQLAALDSEKISEMALALQLDPELQTSLNEHSEMFKELMRQRGLYILWSVYGKDALEHLSAPLRQAIEPRRPLAAGVFDKL